MLSKHIAIWKYKSYTFCKKRWPSLLAALFILFYILVLYWQKSDAEVEKLLTLAKNSHWEKFSATAITCKEISSTPAIYEVETDSFSGEILILNHDDAFGPPAVIKKIQEEQNQTIACRQIFQLSNIEEI